MCQTSLSLCIKIKEYKIFYKNKHVFSNIENWEDNPDKVKTHVQRYTEEIDLFVQQRNTLLIIAKELYTGDPQKYMKFRMYIYEQIFGISKELKLIQESHQLKYVKFLEESKKSSINQKDLAQECISRLDNEQQLLKGLCDSNFILLSQNQNLLPQTIKLLATVFEEISKRYRLNVYFNTQILKEQS